MDKRADGVEVAELAITAEQDQLVVDSTYVDLVKKRLTDLGIEATGKPLSDEGLGLTLLTGLQEGHKAKLAVPVTDLDPILGRLRRDFAAAYGGWMPDMAKNRVASLVVGFPSPRIHGDLHPTPAAEPERRDSQAGEGVKVGIVDTVFYPHDALTVDAEHTLVPDPARRLPMRAGHSAFIADLIRATAPKARLALRCPLNETGRGTLWDTATRIAWFGHPDNRVDVLNLSLGCRTADGMPPLLLTRALAALSPDTVVVASAGNHRILEGLVNGISATSPTWPAALPDVVAVTACDSNGDIAPFAPLLPWVDVVAEGVNVVGAYLKGQIEETTLVFDNWASWSGTSFAAANLTGQIAARTVPDKTTAHEALRQLLADSGTVTRPHSKTD